MVRSKIARSQKLKMLNLKRGDIIINENTCHYYLIVKVIEEGTYKDLLYVYSPSHSLFELYMEKFYKGDYVIRCGKVIVCKQ